MTGVELVCGLGSGFFDPDRGSEGVMDGEPWQGQGTRVKRAANARRRRGRVGGLTNRRNRRPIH
jgi:hypothetical protein